MVPIQSKEKISRNVEQKYRSSYLEEKYRTPTNPKDKL